VRKLSRETLEAWGLILAAAPESRLLLKCRSFEERGTTARLLERLRDAGVPPERVELRAWRATQREHLESYHDIDVALDPFPYNGTATTCEALWMGVPVATLAGSRHVSRVGASLLSSIGLSEWVAADISAYVGIASAAARDPDRVAALRVSLRRRMANSPLCDAAGHARQVESAYRTMWQAWCAGVRLKKGP
jgi:predicted O-linked N-acetylglucosamine transferase (SPINDLY family)